MRKDKITLDRKEYNTLVGYRDSAIDYLANEKREYMDKYCEELKKNTQLQKENGYLKALFDKEADTDVIKYNGKLYRIANKAYYQDETEKTLDLGCVCVGEVK